MMETPDPPTDSTKRSLKCTLFIILVSSLFGQALSQSGGPQAMPFLEFSNNSQTLPNDGVDTVSEEIFIPNGFPFGRTVHSSAFIGDNGVISFSRPFFLYIPEAFPGFVNFDVVAPYWSDNDITSEGSVRYEVFQSGSSSREDTVLATVSNFIKETIDDALAFQGTYMILAEWNGVHPWPHGSDSSSNNFSPSQQAFTALTNTYQAIVITNHEESYAVFTYNCGELQWTGLDTFPTIGFYSASDGIFENHPLVGQSFANLIACDPNPDMNNVIYPIGTVNQQRLRRMCLEWFYSDLNIYDESLIATQDQSAQPCPCSFFQALFDFRFIFANTPSKTSTCFIQRFPNPGGLALRECCYSVFGLVTDTENGGSLLLSPSSTESLQQNNRIPQSVCCAPGVGLCNLYYRRRPQNLCRFYFPLSFVFAFGDPHITTLDGFSYTFNGVGEYVLVRSVDDDIEFQGRTTLVENSEATAFSAFAIRHSGTTVQISSSINGGFTVLVDSIDKSFNLTTNGSNIQMSSYALERLANDSLRLSFSSGVTLTTNITNGMFNFVLNLPPTLNGPMEGLLGTLNNNTSDDLIFRSGTLLPTTSSDAEKHTFGQSWQINETEGIFVYEQGQTVDTFSNPNHIPPFLDEIRAILEVNNTLTNICGNNTQCLFDFGQTGNEAVGMATMDFMQEAMEGIIMSESFPPSISAPDMFMATVEIDSIYTFNVTGSVNVNVIINGQNTLPPNTNFNRSGDTFTLTWNPVNTNEEFNVTIIAIAERDVSSIFGPRVQLCGCINGGNCIEDGVLNLEPSFVILNCDCPAAYDGQFCENDADGCSAISCLEGQLCMDFLAPMAGAMCACPGGYLFIASKCIDIDECDSTHNCTELQTCTNTPGSFECSCRPGYDDSLTSPLRCEDINECDEGRDGCHQICTNTDGSFECSCQSEFVLQSDQRTCSVSANSTCQSSNNICVQVCFVDSVTMQETCSCLPGYQLDSDNTSCSDINECDINNGGCSQNCTNTVGGFSCSCNNNFTLDEDNRTCNDINECQDPTLLMFLCPNTFLCSNLVGGYECVCPSGTELDPDGLICVVIVAPSPTISSSVISVTPNVTAENPDSQSDGLSGGEIAAIVIGSVLGAALVLAVIVVTALWINHRRKSKSVDLNPGQTTRGRGSLRRRYAPSFVIAQDE